MISVTSSEFQKQFGRYKELAQTQPVIVTSYDRESVVLLSAHEFKEYQEHLSWMREHIQGIEQRIASGEEELMDGETAFAQLSEKHRLD